MQPVAYLRPCALALLKRGGGETQLFLQQARYFAGFGVPSHRFLAEDHDIIGYHLEASTAGRDQRQRAQRGSEQRE